ncbi:hypothetical protein LJ707_04035 [Mucilaginibacter sp. UR6-1]|uniref:hypothetical protein n=1 Tax=Mucilaginibacter sp. UR6-1 TaxID=1435643 RepID=UPI001E32247F|nr:hypothetical protein [Mucilaginibacter sp. UR6-1]MCC8408085.1 hypothetical protein [Mucilaginibacter sp. UR6-1]
MMNEQTEAVLTGSDGPIDGIVSVIAQEGYGEGYIFRSIDGTLELIIARNERGYWERVAGSEPYFSGWVDELAEQINNNKQTLQWITEK